MVQDVEKGRTMPVCHELRRVVARIQACHMTDNALPQDSLDHAGMVTSYRRDIG